MDEMFFYTVLLIIWTSSAVLTFAALLFVTAPYGRHMRQGWGPSINATLGWVTMELPSPLLFLVFFLIGGRQPMVIAVAFLFIWELHYIHRSLIFPFRRKNRQSRMPLSIALMAFIFNLINGYLQGRWINQLSPAYEVSWLTDPRFLIGVAIFFTGFIINVHSDQVLFNLRKPGETGYKVPRGGMYRWLSCPNYFGEILEWTGWAVATWSLPGLAFAIWTAANLAPRAMSNHRWYHKTFADYPPERKALIPFIV